MELEQAVSALGGWGNLTAAALLGLAVLGLLTGRLIPRRTLDILIHDRDEWKKAYNASQKLVEDLTTTNKILTEEVGATVLKTMDALPVAPEEEDDPDEEPGIEEITGLVKKWRPFRWLK